MTDPNTPAVAAGIAAYSIVCTVAQELVKAGVLDRTPLIDGRERESARQLTASERSGLPIANEQTSMLIDALIGVLRTRSDGQG